MSSPLLRILHISDLHMGSEGLGAGAWRQRRVLGKAWAHNLEKLLQDGPLDLICFTGDLAYTGKSQEYEDLTPFVEDLLQRVALPRERFFVVPGNHDINRGTARAAWQKLRELGYHEATDVSRWMAGGPALRDIPEAYRDEVLTRQSAYRTWVRDVLARPELLPNAMAGHPRLGYRVELSGWPFPIHVVGLDSAWLAGDSNDARKLRLTDDQVWRLVDTLPGFRIVLVHHPLTDLADGEECRRVLAEQVDLLLRGHLHKPEPSQWSDSARKLYEIAAGCLYEDDRYPNTCQRIDITFDETGRPVRIKVRVRAWSPEGHWYDDARLYPGPPPGCCTVHFCGTSPEYTLHWGEDGKLVGRDSELQALEKALLQERRGTQEIAPVVLHGMPGVGKSYLADRFAYLHREQFPGGYLKLSLSPDEERTTEELGSILARQMKLSWDGWDRLRATLLGPASLVHIENADAERSAKAAAELAHQLHGCAVIVTGRWRGLGESAGWHLMELPVLDEDAAVQQLETELNKCVDRGELQQVSRALGCLPLALHLAAGHLNQGKSVDRFLNQFRKDNLATPLRDFANPRLFVDKTRATVSRTFDLSLGHLEHALERNAEDGQPRMMSFAALGYACPSGFSRSLGAAIAGLSEEDFEDMMDLAVQLSLVDLVPREKGLDQRWRLHPLLAEFLQVRTKDDKRGIDGMTAWFMERLTECDDAIEQDRRWNEIRREGDALEHWLTQVPLGDAERVAREAAWYAITNGPFAAWLAFYARVLSNSQDPSVQSYVLTISCRIALRSGALDRAQADATEKVRLDRDRGAFCNAAHAMAQIGDILSARGEVDEAMRVWRDQALPMYEQVGDIRSCAMIMDKVADTLLRCGAVDEALRIRQKQLLPMYERAGDVRSCAVTMDKIADVLHKRGELEEALRILREQVLPIYDQLDAIRSRGITMRKIADLLQERGELEEALRIHREQVLPVFERLDDVREHAAIEKKIMDIVQKCGEVDEASHVGQ